MGGAIAIAAVLAARLVRIVCPHCGQIQHVERKSVAYRLCSRCRGKFPDPLGARRG